MPEISDAAAPWVILGSSVIAITVGSLLAIVVDRWGPAGPRAGRWAPVRTAPDRCAVPQASGLAPRRPWHNGSFSGVDHRRTMARSLEGGRAIGVFGVSYRRMINSRRMAASSSTSLIEPVATCIAS